MWSSIKYINDGIIASPNGANLSFNVSAGYLYGYGANWVNDPKNPTQLYLTGHVPATFQYRTQTNVSSGNLTVIDATHYDLAGVITAIPGTGNQATNQRLYISPSNTIRIQYGQTVYANMAEAIANIQSEVYVIEPNLNVNLQLIGVLTVRKQATNLSLLTDGRFIQTSKLGELFGGAAGISTATLQSGYNNSVTPEIKTNATLGAVSIQQASGADTDTVLEIVNGAGTIKAKIDGNGKIFTDMIVDLAGTAPTLNQILKYNGTKIVWTDDGYIGVESFTLASSNTSLLVNSAYWAVRIICLQPCTVNRLACFCTQAGNGNMRMGIYDSSSNKLVESATKVNASSGINVFTLSSDYTMTTGNTYYLTLQTQANNAIYLAYTSTLPAGNSPDIRGRYETTNVTDPNLGMPSSFSLYNPTATVLWASAYRI